MSYFIEEAKVYITNYLGNQLDQEGLIAQVLQEVDVSNIDDLLNWCKEVKDH